MVTHQFKDVLPLHSEQFRRENSENTTSRYSHNTNSKNSTETNHSFTSLNIATEQPVKKRIVVDVYCGEKVRVEMRDIQFILVRHFLAKVHESFIRFRNLQDTASATANLSQKEESQPQPQPQSQQDSGWLSWAWKNWFEENDQEQPQQDSSKLQEEKREKMEYAFSHSTSSFTSSQSIR